MSVLTFDDHLAGDGPLSPGRAVELASALLRALDSAHTAGHVHGRLTAADVLVERADTGLLVRLSPPRAEVDPDQLAPEVRAGRAATSATDLWSVGRLLRNGLRATPSGAGPLSWLLEALTHDDPASRPRSARAALDDLELLAPVLSAPPPPPAQPAPATAVAFTPAAGPSVADEDDAPLPLPPVPTVAPGALPGQRQGLADLLDSGAPELDEPHTTATLAEPPTTPTPVPVTEVIPQPAPATSQTARRVGVVVAAVAVVLGLIATGLALVTRGGDDDRAELVAATTLALGFDAQRYPDGLVSAMRWTLSGAQGDSLTANILLTNTSAKPLTTTYDVVIPKSLATDVAQVQFEPAPTKVIKADPVVRYAVALAPGADMSLGYRIAVPADGLTQSRLDSWSSDLAAAELAERKIAPVAVRLASVSLTPATLALEVGQAGQVVVSGVGSDGGRAGAALVYGAAWSSSAPGVASVDQQGAVVAVGPGKTIVAAKVGLVSGSMTVTVTKAPEGAPTVAPRPTTPPALVVPKTTAAPSKPRPAPKPATTTAAPRPAPTTTAPRPAATTAAPTRSPTPSPTPAGAAPTISNVRATLIGDRTVRVEWAVADNGGGPVTCRVLFNGGLSWQGACGGATASTDVGGLAYSTTYLVRVEGSNARGSHAGETQVRTNDAPPPPPPPRTVTVSKGAQQSVTGCTASSCARVYVQVRNFAPNTAFTVSCRDSGGQFYSYTTTTDGAGNKDSSVCVYGYPGKQVWVVVGGVESNHYTW